MPRSTPQPSSGEVDTDGGVSDERADGERFLVGKLCGATAGGALGSLFGPAGAINGALLGALVGDEYEKRERRAD